MAEGTEQQMEMPKNGEICWTEIAVTDLDACKSFYENVFGWQIEESKTEVSEFEYYEYDTGEGYKSGGIYELTDEMKENNLPPHFVNYIAVDDLDASAEKVKELGGTIMVEPQEIPNTGRMCVAQDPTGAMFALLTLNSQQEDK